MNLLDGYGMDTITMAGPLEAKLEAMKVWAFRKSCSWRVIWWGTLVA